MTGTSLSWQEMTHSKDLWGLPRRHRTLFERSWWALFDNQLFLALQELFTTVTMAKLETGDVGKISYQ